MSCDLCKSNNRIHYETERSKLLCKECYQYLVERAYEDSKTLSDVFTYETNFGKYLK